MPYASSAAVATSDVALTLPVSDILARLQSHPNVNPILKQLLDIECQFKSANQGPIINKNHIEKFEDQKFELLKSLDANVDPLTFNFLDSYPITDNIRCITWLENSNATEQSEEQGFFPFANCVVAKKMHVMMYNIQANQSLQNVLLKVVVADSEISLDCNLDLPADRSSKVIVVVLPEIGANQVINSVKVMRFLDRS